jgi:hypothetical protein
MVAFLTVDVPWAHAAPALPCTAYGAVGTAWPRPVLTARWLIAPDGRLTCRWQTDVSAPFGPPPH